ncbi:MAG: type 3 dihydrofolate reductase [Candidatus Dasytiphilus stammeri]
MIISLIVAKSYNNVIGINNSLPWNLSLDKIWFKKHTWKKPIIMGRNTWESLRERPLQGRYNIVISKKNYSPKKNVVFVNSIESALSICQQTKEIMIIGGASIYNQMITRAHFLYLTSINLIVSGDTYFPLYDSAKWFTIYQDYHLKTNTINYSYCFEILKKKK